MWYELWVVDYDNDAVDYLNDYDTIEEAIEESKYVELSLGEKFQIREVKVVKNFGRKDTNKPLSEV